MPQGQLYINGQDAFTTYGLSMDKNALSQLLTPPPLKEAVVNDSPLENGSRVVGTPKVAPRELTLGINFIASSESDFFTKYASFCTLLKSGTITLRTSFQSTVAYHCKFISCTNFAEFKRGIAKYTLRLIEYDPTSRTVGSNE